MSFLDELRRRGLDLQKETHPSKTYLEHVRECREIADIMTKVYGFSKELVDFTLLLCDAHDVGKLLPSWHIARKERPLHSIEGAEWFINVEENAAQSVDQTYRAFAAYMIASHHSPLYVPFAFIDLIDRAERFYSKRYFKEYSRCRRLADAISRALRSLDESRRRDLADVLGIVKVADLTSAKGLPKDDILANYMWPEGLEEGVRRVVFERACEKRGSFDWSKFERQRAIASSEEMHLLVAAPTGWGKTALALLRTIFKRPTKVFYILPTITAIRDFYRSFTKILGKKYVGEYFYFADVELLKGREADEEHLLDVYRYFIPKVVITTIDQLLLTTLQVGRYYIRRFNLRNSLIVFDEFHLLTPQMIGCVRAFLRGLRGYGFSCLFMSATPSPLYEEMLKEALPQMKVLKLDDEYRRLSRHKIVYASDKTVEDFVSEGEDLLRGRRTLIIANTVGEAQRLYSVLREELGGSRRLLLIHGDFAYRDRMEKEAQIERADIIVSTQVAEVSLDISLDLLITELAPLPSLIQRLGRVNRYETTTATVNVYVCKPRSDRPYGSRMMRQARETLSSLIHKVEQEKEAAYLNEEIWQYEQIYRDEVLKVEARVSERMDEILDFFSLLVREGELLEFLGREETLLAVPEAYFNEVLSLLQKLRRADGFEERMNLYAQIKGFLAPVSHSDVAARRAYWSDDLRAWVIKNYDKDLGVVRV